MQLILHEEHLMYLYIWMWTDTTWRERLL